MAAIEVFHFSEDPTISEFVPCTHPHRPGEEPQVWAIDAAHAPLYYFPRDCPRVAFWALSHSVADDRERFLGHTQARCVIAIESDWLARVRATCLYVYRLPGDTFAPMDGPGYYTSQHVIMPHSVAPVGDLLARLADAGVELRLTPSLWPLAHALPLSSLHYALIRLRNTCPDPGASQTPLSEEAEPL